MRGRAIILGLLLVPLNCLWLSQMEMATQYAAGYGGGPYPTTFSLFANVILLLLILSAVNSLLRRACPRIIAQGAALRRSAALVARKRRALLCSPATPRRCAGLAGSSLAASGRKGEGAPRGRFLAALAPAPSGQALRCQRAAARRSVAAGSAQQLLLQGGVVMAFVGFCGSRRLSACWSGLVSRVVASVLVSGRGVAVGCASGADALVRQAAPGSQVFRASAFGSGRAAFARRSAALVQAVVFWPWRSVRRFRRRAVPSVGCTVFVPLSLLLWWGVWLLGLAGSGCRPGAARVRVLVRLRPAAV